MKIYGLIPARYSSTRFPGKPLASIAGKPMIQHVVEGSRESGILAEVIVATDDKRIKKKVESFGGKAVMTSPNHTSGTDRIAEAAAGLDCDLVVNIQGDEPLIKGEMIKQAVQPFHQKEELPMSTLKRRITRKSEIEDPNTVKVVCNCEGDALYFSRSPIPGNLNQEAEYYKHIGLYVYRRDFLLNFARLAPTPLENFESLEQLRALENGYQIRVVETEYKTVGVDKPEDIDRVEKELL